MNLVNYYMALPYGVNVIHEESGDAPPYVAFIRELPGCMAQGRTPAEALQELHEAKYLFIEAMIDHGVPIPAPMPVAQPPVMQGEFRLSIPEPVPEQPQTTTPSVRLVPA